MQQYAQRNFKKYLHYYIFPRWAAEKKYLVLVWSIISVAGGVCGAGLSIAKSPLAIYVWHVGILSTFICITYFLKGIYQVYLDRGWDTLY